MADEEKSVVMKVGVEGTEETEAAYERISKAIRNALKDAEKAAASEQKAIQSVRVKREKAMDATEKLIDSAVNSQLKQSSIQENLSKQQINIDDKLIDRATDTQVKESRDAEIEDQKEMQKRSLGYANALMSVSKITTGLVSTFKKFGYGLASSIRQMGAFRPEYLSMMFFGMALSKVFEANIKDMLQLTGVTQTYAVTIRMMLLPVMMPMIKGLYGILIPIMKMPAPFRMAAGAAILVAFAIGKILFVVGTLALAFFGFLALFANAIASFVSFTVTIIGAVASLGAFIVTTLASAVAVFILGKAIDEATLVTLILKLALLVLGFMLLTWLLPIILATAAVIFLLLSPFLLIAAIIGGIILVALALLGAAFLDQTEIGKKFKEVIISVWKGIKEFILGAVDTIIEWVGKFFDWLVAVDWGRVWNKLVTALTPIIPKVLELLSTIMDKVEESGLVEKAGVLMGKIVNKMISIVLNTDWMPMFRKIFEYTSAIAQIITTLGIKVARLLWDALLAFFKTVDWSAIFTGLKNTLKGVAGGAYEGLKDLVGLQRGGIVMQPTLAMVGENGPEAVIPLRDAEREMSSSIVFSPNVYITANVASDIDINTLGEKLTRQWNDDLRRLLIRK